LNFLELCRKRQSERNFSDKPVSEDLIERCLEAARLAPSACNSQPWHFVVINDPDLKRRFVGDVFTGMYSMNSFARLAPVIIAVVSEGSAYAAKMGGFLRGVHFSGFDIGAAVEHLVLQARESGVSACVLGWFNERAAKNILAVPRRKKLDLLIALGYPAQPSHREKRRKSIDEIRSYNGYPVE
jgi:nitroreductase